MSDVPGSLNVTRCTSKPAAFRMFSSTPSAPASAGVTDGQRTRSRVMETASFIARLNTPNRRRASLVRDHFDFGLLIPGRPRIDRRQRVGAEPVVPSRAPEEEQLDHAPEAQNECTEAKQYLQDDEVGKPLCDLIRVGGKQEERDHPPGPLVAVVQTLDRGGK